MYKYVFEYPAFTGKVNSKYAAYCKALKIIGVGSSEYEAVDNLQKAASKHLNEHEVIISPVNI